MKVLVPGHTYLVSNFETDTDGHDGQVIQFIHKEPIEEGSTTLKTLTNGTTNEELMEILLDRLEFANKKLPSRETALAITNLEQALMWCLRRTSKRKARGVEGTMAK